MAPYRSDPMTSTKKQDKPSTVREQAVPASADQALNSPPSGSDATTADAIASGVATTVPGADPGATAAQEAGGPATELSVELAQVSISTADAESAGVSTSQPGQAGDTLHVAPGAAGLDELTSSAPVKVNPTKVRVYPLRSFMDEGEMRRRGGPSYQVSRRHAEELELRNLVSRTPLEE